LLIHALSSAAGPKARGLSQIHASAATTAASDQAPNQEIRKTVDAAA
jgi:hypothetical protein